MYASFEGYPEIVLKLLDNAANPNIQNHVGVKQDKKKIKR
jgi:hypothetical protein